MDTPGGSTSTHNSLLERLNLRKEQMMERNKQRRLERETLAGESGNADHFLRALQELKGDLEGRVKEARDVEKAEHTSYLDNLVRGVQDMQDLLNESSMYLASFQQKKAQQDINEVNALVQEAVKELQPKKKFGFGRKKAPEKGDGHQKEPRAKESSNTPAKIPTSDSVDSLIERQFFGFKDEANCTLTMAPAELENRQLNLHNLQDCTVLALGTPGALQAASLERCTVVTGPTARSAFIKDCTHCTFVIACQQVRIHSTSDTDFYLHVTGAAIIEDCQGVRFAPYALQYPDLDQHYLSTNLDRQSNRWDQVDDFHWLNENERSPNWSVIPEVERRSDWLA